jgi:oxalate decarboxylase/phosphoglucose isomerase-like protein (cupin superfamily)
MENKGLLIINKTHHPKADIDEIYVKRKGEGRNLLLK